MNCRDINWKCSCMDGLVFDEDELNCIREFILIFLFQLNFKIVVSLV